MSKTQFLIVLAINVFMFGILFGHIFNEQVRTVTQTVTKQVPVYKGQKIVKVPQIVTKNVPVQVCDKTQLVSSYIQEAQKACSQLDGEKLSNFSIDTSNNPKFNCQ